MGGAYPGRCPGLAYLAPLGLGAPSPRCRSSKSVTLDWTLREGARARIKVMVKRILNKHRRCSRKGSCGVRSGSERTCQSHQRPEPTSSLGREGKTKAGWVGLPNEPFELVTLLPQACSCSAARSPHNCTSQEFSCRPHPPASSAGRPRGRHAKAGGSVPPPASSSRPCGPSQTC